MLRGDGNGWFASQGTRRASRLSGVHEAQRRAPTQAPKTSEVSLREYGMCWRFLKCANAGHFAVGSRSYLLTVMSDVVDGFPSCPSLFASKRVRELMRIRSRSAVAVFLDRRTRIHPIHYCCPWSATLFKNLRGVSCAAFVRRKLLRDPLQRRCHSRGRGCCCPGDNFQRQPLVIDTFTSFDAQRQSASERSAAMMTEPDSVPLAVLVPRHLRGDADCSLPVRFRTHSGHRDGS